MNIDWLLKKIKNHIPEVYQKEILKREGNEGVRPKDKKRERDSFEDNEGNLSKKTKDEEQINLKRLIDLVDDKYPKSSQ